MPRSSRTDWLPNASSVPSRSDLLAQLVAASGSPGGVGSERSSGASNAAQDVLAGALQGPARDVTQEVSSLNAQLSSLTSAQQVQIGAIQDNTQAVLQNTTVKTSGGSSVGGAVGDIASTILGGGLSLSPLVSGLLSLFGGGSDQTATAPAPFMLPAPVQYQVGLTNSAPGQAVPVDYGNSGPRSQVSGDGSQINIQVQAMDSQSILDHSDEIATAVKAAILHSHSLGDVIADL